MKYLLAIFACIALHAASVAQSARANKSSAGMESGEVFMRERRNAFKFARRFRAAPTRNAFAEARLKERKKMAEEMKKPQYSDKMYFGHKRMPKKRPLRKRGSKHIDCPIVF